MQASWEFNNKKRDEVFSFSLLVRKEVYCIDILCRHENRSSLGINVFNFIIPWANNCSLGIQRFRIHIIFYFSLFGSTLCICYKMLIISNALMQIRLKKRHKVSHLDWMIQQCCFYPDGTPKKGPDSPARKNPNDYQRCLIQALLDQYNEDHDLFQVISLRQMYVDAQIMVYDSLTECLVINFRVLNMN